MNIAILKNDSVTEELRSRFPDYEEMIENWIAPLNPLGSDPSFTVYDLQKGEEPSFDHDLYISSGSRKSVYVDAEWLHQYREFTLKIHERKKPHFGICFGHQMIAYALGGTVAKSESGWGVGVHRWGNHQRELMEDESLALCVSHQDQVIVPPPNMKLFLSSEFCPIAGFSVGNHILTVQGHPEFEPAYVEAIMEMRKEIYPESVYLEGKDSLKIPTQAGLLLPVIKDFFRL